MLIRTESTGHLLGACCYVLVPTPRGALRELDFAGCENYHRSTSWITFDMEFPRFLFGILPNFEGMVTTNLCIQLLNLFLIVDDLLRALLVLYIGIAITKVHMCTFVLNIPGDILLF
jgi:hypothetical protein